MFAKLARFNGFGRRHAPLPAAKTAYANDNHPGRRRTAASPRTRRQILLAAGAGDGAARMLLAS
jgi:hypothetical protein